MKIKSTKQFIPEWNGNRALPTNEQIVIHYKSLRYKFTLKYGVSENATMEAQQEFQDQILRHHIVRVENLVIDDKPIVSSDEFCECEDIDLELVKEVVEVVTDTLPKEKKDALEKN